MNRLEEINELIKNLQKSEIQVPETDAAFGYIIEGAPTIIEYSQQDKAFQLHVPRTLTLLPKISEYVDRVAVSTLDKNEDIERVVRLMKAEASKFKSTNGTHHNDFGFEMPGQENKFFREVNGSPNQIELRYCVQSFSKI